MKVLLLQAPAAVLSPHAQLSPPLGIAYIAQYLIDRGHVVELVDLNLTGLSPERLRATLKRFEPDMVGVSSLTETYPNALRIAAAVKAYDPAITVLLGGAHVSIRPLEALAAADVDFVAVGEGEATAAELAAALESGADAAAIALIAGLGHKLGGVPVLNSPRPLLDPATAARPARHLLSLEFYEDAYNILASRGGCPYRCPFCSASQLWGGRRRPRPVEDVVAELDEVLDTYGAEHVFFVDDILTVDRRWFERLLDALMPYAGRFRWGCATRVDRVDEELLRRMAAAGCSGVQFGVESGSQRILDSVKGIDKRAALDAVRWATAAGITASCSFMVPFPDDTEETLAETFEFMETLRNAGGRLLVSYTTPYPGTMFADRAEELGLNILTDDWTLYDAKHVVMETRALTAARIETMTASAAEALGLHKSM